MKIESLGLKISLIVVLMITLIIGIIIYDVSVKSGALITNLAVKEAKAANLLFAKELQALQSEAFSTAVMVANSYEVVVSILEDDGVRLKSALLNLGENVDTVSVTDVNGDVLMRMHSDKTGDNIIGQKVISNALAGTNISILEEGALVGLSTRAGATIRDSEGKIIGAVVSGHNLSDEKYVDRLKEASNSELSIYYGDTIMNTTLIDENGDRAIEAVANDVVIETVLIQKQDYSLRTELFGVDYYAHYSPLIIDGEAIGMLFTGVHIDEAVAERQAMMKAVLTVGIVCGCISILLVFLLNSFSISRPLRKIGAFALKISSGDIGVSSSYVPEIDVRSHDEIGKLARELERAYVQLHGYIKEIIDRMQSLAEGDLVSESTSEFEGDFVLIKDAINNIVHNLNQTLSEVTQSSEQVSVGAKQIADAANFLAQSSTEQAASIDNLSNFIAGIAEKTGSNAEMAVKAALLANTIKISAEKGSRQMNDMTAAVNEISDASDSIVKVIKVIDDIAFQTNILALNAAVEAARAGQHGKGFAVVADEVRSLAGKSAEAARDTGILIQDSIEKAQLGVQIAEETAGSLAEIVSGINESSQLMVEIAHTSEEQSSNIAQINIGIDQVADVIQQNSANSEQSAAASEELSGQSEMMMQLISQFKLKDENEM